MKPVIGRIAKLVNMESGETGEEWSTRLGGDTGLHNIRMALQENLARDQGTEKVAPHVVLVREVLINPAEEDQEAFELQRMLSLL